MTTTTQRSGADTVVANRGSTPRASAENLSERYASLKMWPPTKGVAPCSAPGNARHFDWAFRSPGSIARCPGRFENRLRRSTSAQPFAPTTTDRVANRPAGAGVQVNRHIRRDLGAGTPAGLITPTLRRYSDSRQAAVRFGNAALEDTPLCDARHGRADAARLGAAVGDYQALKEPNGISHNGVRPLHRQCGTYGAWNDRSPHLERRRGQ